MTRLNFRAARLSFEARHTDTLGISDGVSPMKDRNLLRACPARAAFLAGTIRDMLILRMVKATDVKGGEVRAARCIPF